MAALEKNSDAFSTAEEIPKRVMGLIIILFFYIFLSWLIACWGRYRLFGFWGYFFASLLLTPFLGILFVIASKGNDRYVVLVNKKELEVLQSTRSVGAAVTAEEGRA